MVSIIMPVYNRPELTRQTLDSLWSTLRKCSIPYDFIIVDNGSEPDTARILKQHYDGFHLVRVEKNIGIGAAKNLGVKAALYDWLYITDNDLYYYPGWLESLFATAKAYPEAKIVGSFRHNYHGLVKRHDRDGILFEQSDQQVGSSWLLTKKTWAQFGPLKEGVDYGIDDVAFCNKVTKAGFWVGSISPHKAYHCGIKNSDGNDTPDANHLRKITHPKGILVQ
jgi:glycosyltransferase involved in cell wall biosynthesis